MPVPAGFVQALVDYAEAIDDVTPLKEERDALYERMKAGESGALLTSTVNGKTFGFSPTTITVEEKFTAFSQAVREFEGTRVTTTYGGFGHIDR